MKETSVDFAAQMLRGVEHFNAAEFWEAHEAWEAIWLEAKAGFGQYVQGLIQIAAAYHHLKRGTLRGGVRLFDAAFARLDHFPNPYCGIDRAETIRAALGHRDWAAARVARNAEEPLDSRAFPKLSCKDKSQVVRPASDAS